MFTIIRNARIGSSPSEQLSHLVLAGGKIVTVLDAKEGLSAAHTALATKTLDVEGHYVLPGLIDGHTHPLGAAGEDGPATRAPEIPLEVFLRSGITSIVGMLGLDDVSRSVAALVARIRGLRAGGLNAYCLSGSYRFPTASLGESTAWDLYFIPDIIGVGEVAISDVRSSAPSRHELQRLIQETHTAARSAGKRGAVLFHVGDERSGLGPIFDIIENSSIDPSKIIVTHLNRNPLLLSQVARAAEAGLWCDFTAIEFEKFPPGFVRAEDALAELLHNHPHLENRLTMTSDCGTYVGGRQPTSPASLYRAFCRTARNPEVGLRRAIKIYMENPARCYGLSGKGVVEVGADADLFIAGDQFEVEHLFCGGVHVIENGAVTASELLDRSYGAGKGPEL